MFSTAASAKFQELVAPYMAPSMEYKLLPRFRGQGTVTPEFVEPTQQLVSARVLDVHVKPQTRSMNRFDIEVEGNHNYFVDGVMVHNSPETTTGGKALKFYASVRLDVRRIETLKDGTDAVGNRTRVKVVKNKVSPPFKQAEFDILYGKGISREGSLIDMGVDQGFIRKSGSWFTYEGEQLGQGKENVRNFLMENADVANEIEKKIKEKLGIGAVVTDDPSVTVSCPPPSTSEPSREEQARALCLRLLTARSRTRAELSGQLSKRGYPDDVRDRVLDRLAAVGLVDDTDFAEQWVQSRRANAGKEQARLGRRVAHQGRRQRRDHRGAGRDRRRCRAGPRRAAGAGQAAAGDAGRRDDVRVSRRLVAMLARRGYSQNLACEVVLAELAAERERRRV